MEHKHAVVLRAIADGKDVQLRTALQGVWIDFDVDSHINPITSGINAEWRIKPEPKPDVVCSGRVIANAWSFDVVYHGLPNLRLTFDGEDQRKLKSAQVLP